MAKEEDIKKLFDQYGKGKDTSKKEEKVEEQKTEEKTVEEKVAEEKEKKEEATIKTLSKGEDGKDIEGSMTKTELTTKDKPAEEQKVEEKPVEKTEDGKPTEEKTEEKPIPQEEPKKIEPTPEPEKKEESPKEEEKPTEEPKGDVVKLAFTKPKTEEEKKEKIAFSSKEPSEKEGVDEEKKEKVSFTPMVKKEDTDFDLSDAEMPMCMNFMIYARKGDGKTSLAFSIPGNHNCISFDNKSQAIKEQLDDPARVVVKDGIRYIDESSPERKLESAHMNWRYINKLVDSFETRDWCDVDGGEIFHTMAEMVMRYKNNLMPFQGISNLNLWKERRMYIKQLFRACQRKAKKGVIWTAYVEKDEIIENGDFVSKKDVPKYIDVVLYETDCVIKCETKKDNVGKVEFYATVESCKIPEKVQREILGGVLKVGKQINVTGKMFGALIEKG